MANHLTCLFRMRASRSRVAISDLMHLAITSLTASSAHLWMSSLAMCVPGLFGLSMPSFGLGSNV